MSESSRAVWIVRDAGDELASSGPVGWASEQPRDALDARGVPTGVVQQLNDTPTDAVCIAVAGRSSALTRELLDGVGITVPDAPEVLGLIPRRLGTRHVVLATGSDPGLSEDLANQAYLVVRRASA